MLQIHLARGAQTLFLGYQLIKYSFKQCLSPRVAVPMASAVFLGLVWLFQPLPPAPQLAGYTYRPVLIPRGASLQAIADSLSRHGLLNQPDLFLFLGRVTGKDRRIKSGLLEVPVGLPPYALLTYLAHARPHLIKVTIPEGLRSEQIAAILAREVGIDSARFMHLVRDSVFTRRLGLRANSLEGYLLPETYFLPWKPEESTLIHQMVQSTLQLFQADSIQRRLRELHMSVHQVLTLASIIEGEVVVDSERVLVSSVYHNRLRRGWRLQADPTIQFILKGRPRRLTYRDLEIDSPYNTYRYRGLPPGPINNPGRRSILAALYPARTDYLYFVATGDGRHHFSRTQREHLIWKRKFNRLRRQVAREQWKRKRSAGRH